MPRREHDTVGLRTAPAQRDSLRGQDRSSSQRPSSCSRRHCELCHCVVVLRPGAWEEHTRGIRHRRNVLGSQNVSIFEDVDHLRASAAAVRCSAAPATTFTPSQQPHCHRYQQQHHQKLFTYAAAKDPVVQTLLQRQGAPIHHQPAPDTVVQASQQLHVLLLRHVPHLTGRVGRQLPRVCEQFTPAVLQQAFATLRAKLDQVATAVAAQARTAEPGPVGTALQASAAELACLAWQCRQRGYVSPHLLLRVPFQGPDSVEAASTFTALCVLCKCLHQAPGTLHTLGLRLVNVGGLYRQLLSQAGEVVSQRSHAMWQRLLRAIAELAQARGDLQEVVLTTPPLVLATGALEELSTALADPAPRRAKRLALLMSTHPRLGSHSLLGRLPLAVLERIMDLAIPLQPCKLTLRLCRFMMRSVTSSLPDGRDSGDVTTSGEEDSDESDGSSSGDEGGQAGGAGGMPVAPDVLAVVGWL